MKKKAKEPYWTLEEKQQREQKEGETETDEKNALVLFGIMFSEIRKGDDILDKLAEIFSEEEKK
jgi:hypothetical protein